MARAGRELSPGDGGVFRSRVFPGLRADRKSLLAEDAPRLPAVLELGLATAEHREIARQLRA
ncbi:MAG: Uma2 family endonuclease, partial [Thermoanaerobaculia bacterium]